MKKHIINFSLGIIMVVNLISGALAQAAVSATASFQLKVTIPEHVITPSKIENLAQTNEKEFDITTQNVVRDHKPVVLKTITSK